MKRNYTSQRREELKILGEIPESHCFDAQGEFFVKSITFFSPGCKIPFYPLWSDDFIQSQTTPKMTSQTVPNLKT